MPPLLPDASGAPILANGLAGSISHKGPLALALAARTLGRLGVDVEYVGGDDEALAGKVLTEEERRRLAESATPDAAQLVAVHFAVKEAIYKALDVETQVDLEFDDVELDVPSITRGEWLRVAARVAPRPNAVISASVLVDGGWLIAAACCGG